MDNRSNILDCALELFANKGYDAVGVQEIVETAGITKPTLYHYFGSKHGLLKTLLELYFSELNQVVAEAAVYKGDLPFTLRKLARAWFGFAQKYPTFYRLALALLFTPIQGEAYGVVAELHERQHRQVEQVFALAVENHGNMRGRQKLYAATFVGQINTCIFLWLGKHLELNEAVIERTIHQFEHGIYS
ncbi:MAG: TetR/AcrR family transcriptional regulator [Anaerolineae bacterium]|nr:TetR/AcrR family transcriptional regulator [Anaerolineae bacterium]